LALIFSLGAPAAVEREAWSYLQQGRFQDADKLCRTALAAFEKDYGPYSLEVALMLKDLTACADFPHRRAGRSATTLKPLSMSWYYSARNADMGSTRVARMAGNHAADKANTTAATVLIAYITGEPGVTPITTDRIDHATSARSTRPSGTPHAVMRSDSPTTSRVMSAGSAPSDMRKPISRVLRLTLY
jgi:hypothetical protein